MGRARPRSPSQGDTLGPLGPLGDPADASDAAGRKRFTLAEANRALPYLRRVVGDIVEQYAHIVTLRTDRDASNAQPAPQKHYEQAMDRLGYLVDELHAVGVELRDFEHGVIAFPATHHERQILLSWQPPEPAVTHWHSPEESITDRRPLPALAA